MRSTGPDQETTQRSTATLCICTLFSLFGFLILRTKTETTAVAGAGSSSLSCTRCTRGSRGSSVPGRAMETERGLKTPEREALVARTRWRRSSAAETRAVEGKAIECAASVVSESSRIKLCRRHAPSAGTEKKNPVSKIKSWLHVLARVCVRTTSTTHPSMMLRLHTATLLRFNPPAQD